VSVGGGFLLQVRSASSAHSHSRRQRRSPRRTKWTKLRAERSTAGPPLQQTSAEIDNSGPSVGKPKARANRMPRVEEARIPTRCASPSPAAPSAKHSPPQGPQPPPSRVSPFPVYTLPPGQGLPFEIQVGIESRKKGPTYSGRTVKGKAVASFTMSPFGPFCPNHRASTTKDRRRKPFWLAFPGRCSARYAVPALLSARPHARRG